MAVQPLISHELSVQDDGITGYDDCMEIIVDRILNSYDENAYRFSSIQMTYTRFAQDHGDDDCFLWQYVPI
jgi:hypothetical protein